jgi:hypothetical protein
MNTGAFSTTLNPPLKPLSAAFVGPDGLSVKWNGHVLSIGQTFNTLDELSDLVEGVYFVIPMYLNVDFADPPTIDRVEGDIAGIPFSWELMSALGPTHTTTQDQQEESALKAWERLSLTSNVNRRRLLAALHYFHVACRLSRQAGAPGEFLSEVLLNFAKTLVVLFPPSGKGMTYQAARRGLERLGYTSSEIERQFIPALCFRNKIDVGHVDLSIYTREQLTLIHDYAENAEKSFRALLSRMLAKIASGEYEVQPYVPGPPDKETLETIDRLKSHQRA